MAPSRGGMRLTRLFVWVFWVGVVVSGVSVVSGQTFPSKPIRIVTANAGGGADFAARLIARGLSSRLGQQAVVENRGGSATIPVETVAKAPPDGYTLLLYSNSMWTLPLIQSVPYDPVRNFVPITLAVSTPNVLVVHPSVPVKSVKELIAFSKSKPGQLNYASTVTGTSSHLSGELFKAMAGVDIVRVNYKGAGPALNDLLAGQVQMMFAAAASAVPHLKSERLRGLAITSRQPSALAPGLPTLAASGLPEYEAVTIYAMFAPAGTPSALVNRLSQEVVQYLSRTDIKEKFFNIGVETVGSSPEQLGTTVKSEMTRLGKLIKDAGIHAD